MPPKTPQVKGGFDYKNMPKGLQKGNKPWNKNRKMNDYPQMGFQKGHLFYRGGEKSWFKKGHKIKHSKETIEKIRNKLMGNKNSAGLILSEAAKKKLSEIHKGKKNKMWKGGRFYNRNGYVLIKLSEHPNANSGGYILEHKLVMANKVKRSIMKNEIIHHINYEVDDNRIENLYLMKRTQHNIYENNVRVTYFRWIWSEINTK